MTVLTVLMLASLFAGCAAQSPPVRTTVVPYDIDQLKARDAAKDARYLIRPGDILRLTFKYEKILNEPRVLVLPDGYMTIPGMGSIKAAGRTIPELDAELNAMYGKEYRNPDLTLVMVELTEPEIYVLGNVEHPGLYKIPYAGMGVMQAITLAGGFSRGANKSNAVVMRAGQDGFILNAYDLGHIERDGIKDLSYFDLQPYDIVYVPQSKVGDFEYVVSTVFGPTLDVSRFFWDVYAFVNIDKIDRLVR